MRDKTIDRLRGFAMLWVLLVHVLYWTEWFDTTSMWLSFSLIEMPLFFFLTGASNSFSDISQPLMFVKKRWKRILIPYLIFAAVSLSVIFVHLACTKGLPLPVAGLITFAWLFPFATPYSSLPYLSYAIWFVPVYLCIIFLLSLLKRTTKKRLYVGLALLIATVLFDVLNLQWVQNLPFYAFWTYLGLFYTEIKEAILSKKAVKWLIPIAVVSIGALVALGLNGVSLNMQDNKFPPNSVFMLFAMASMSILGLLFPLLDRLLAWIEKTPIIGHALTMFSKHSLTVFLWHPYAFLAIIPLMNLLPVPALIKAAGAWVLIAIMCVLCAPWLGKIEDIGQKSKTKE